jgi:transposase
MDRHQADSAEQAAWRSPGKRPTRSEWNFPGFAIRSPLRDLPEAFGPYTTCYNRFVQWRRAGFWGCIIDALAAALDAAVQMIDTSIVRVHQHGACITRNQRQ